MDEVSHHGVFPFGQVNLERQMRLPLRAVDAVVIGVYPSAFHVSWSPPPALDPRPVDARRRAFISSLAVDVEPTVFWTGEDPSPDAELYRWKAAVGFDPVHHGTVSTGNNGPSGAGLVTDVLAPLGLNPAAVAFTDAVPWFFVKRGPNSQGDAITTRFNPIAVQLGLREGDLPTRPTTKQLVGIASSTDRASALRAEILKSRAPLVITVGQEALDAVRSVADGSDGVQTRLAPDEAYGRRGELSIDRSTVALVGLAHPGFMRQTTNTDWKNAFSSWKAIRNTRNA